jgi:hypothetical protein
LNSILTIVGIIVGSIFILIGLFDIHTNGIVPGILIGLMVFRGFKNKASSHTVIIVAAAFFGIVGGLVVVGALALGIAVWYYTTYCC